MSANQPTVLNAEGKPAAKKPARTLRFNTDTSTLTLTITTGRKVKETAYSVERIGSDFGDGFRLTKNVGSPEDECDIYCVHLSNEGHSCECLGFLRWNHCKHIEALCAMRKTGTI